MPISERLPGSLQENLITLLVHSDEYGKIVANLVDPTLYDGDYRVIAERAVDYWRRYDRAPGPHIGDELAEILDPKYHDRRAGTFRSILLEMLRLVESINAKYTLDRARSFVRMQQFQSAVEETAKKLAARQEIAIPEVEEMWVDLLRTRDSTFERGVSLNDIEHLIDFLQNQATEFKVGIDELDARGIAPMRGAVMLLIASTGIGKSWGLIHLAKRALMERKKVLYASLELSEGELLMRFYQAFFSVTDRKLKDPLFVSTVEKDGDGRLLSIGSEEIIPEFSLDSSNLEEELMVRRQLMQGKFKNIDIKRFPTRGLTINKLAGYLDSLETMAGFIPDVLILDYIGIMKTDMRDHRVSLGTTFEDFRGLCVERNIAGITAQQINRVGGKAKRASQFEIAEAWALAGTADVTLSISATSAEKRFGLARLFVEKSRRTRDRFGVIITQNYDTGQFVLESAPYEEVQYDKVFAAYAGDDGPGDEEDG